MAKVIEEVKSVEKPEVEIKANGDKSTLSQLAAQKKKPIMIPIDENMEPLMVAINGCIYSIPKGELIEVPESIFDIVQEAQIKTMKAKAQIKI